MPALLPPSMQIGALPQGYSPLPPNGPQRQLMQTPAAPVILQSVGATTNVSGPTNIAQAVSGTKVGTFLVWAVAVNASAAAALGGVPTGWSLAASQTVATLALGIYVFRSNPGAISTVTFSSNATATTGGIASWFWEIDNCPFSNSGINSANGNSTSPAAGVVTPQNDASLLLGIVGWVLGAATFTNTSTGGSAWTTNAQQSSTNGTTNAALETGQNISNFGTQGAANWQGTLSAGAVWAACLIAIPSSAGGNFTQGATRATEVDQGAGYSTGDLGNTGWSLGGTKPGGAGSGQ